MFGPVNSVGFLKPLLQEGALWPLCDFPLLRCVEQSALSCLVHQDRSIYKPGCSSSIWMPQRKQRNEVVCGRSNLENLYSSHQLAVDRALWFPDKGKMHTQSCLARQDEGRRDRDYS